MKGRARPPEHAAAGSVYWMESSKRRQALEWLAREDLTPLERETLETFASDYRTATGLAPAERRSLLAAFDRIARRLRALPQDLPEGSSDHSARE